MELKTKIIFCVIIWVGLMFGFLDIFIQINPFNFDRLHIFLFNLCCGCSIILYYTENKKKISNKVLVYLALTFIYAMFAFFQIYFPTIIITFALIYIVESIRIKRFSFFPFDFFKPVPVFQKFHQASLLCLSIGLIISCLVIVNHQYLHVVDLKTLTLDTFFLGFSFPISLITMSVIFSLMKESKQKYIFYLQEACFWVINLGVITFFAFIIFNTLILQFCIAIILSTAVCTVLYLYYKLGTKIEQKKILTSGIFFLLFTALTGMLYIIVQCFPGYLSQNYKWLLKLHALVSLYGWNLCGLSVICSYKLIKHQIHTNHVIFFHWLTVAVLAPLGLYFRPFSIIALIAFIFLLNYLFIKQKNELDIGIQN